MERKSHFRGIKRLCLAGYSRGQGIFRKGEGGMRNTCRRGRKPAHRSHGPFLKGLTAITKKYME